MGQPQPNAAQPQGQPNAAQPRGCQPNAAQPQGQSNEVRSSRRTRTHREQVSQQHFLS